MLIINNNVRTKKLNQTIQQHKKDLLICNNFKTEPKDSKPGKH